MSADKYRALRAASVDFVNHESPPIRKPPDLEQPTTTVAVSAPLVVQTIAAASPPADGDPFDRVDEALRRIAAAAARAED